VRHASFVALGAVALTLAGCAASPEKQVVGKWKGSVTLPPNMAKDPRAGMLKGMFSNLTLEVKEDKKFTLTMMVPIEGTWSVSGKSLTLQPTKIMGMDVKQAQEMAKKQGRSATSMDKPMKMTLSEDGKTLTAENPESSQGGSMTFTRDESK